MKKVSRKEIILRVEGAIGSVLKKLKISSPSKKTEKLIEKVSRKISAYLKEEIRKQDHRIVKAGKKSRRSKINKVKIGKTASL